MLRSLISCACALALSAPAATAGDLNPPPGPVAPTMKTLDEAEPSTPIQSLPSGSTALHMITQPGAYHLTGNLDLRDSTLSAIRASGTGVLIDLRGFTIIGDTDETVPAIRTGSFTTVRNGTIDNWGAEGIQTFGRVTVENMQFDFIQGPPIDNGSSTVLRDCQFRFCAPLEPAGDTLIDGCLFDQMGEAINAPGVSAISILDTVIDGQNTGNGGHVIIVGNDAQLTNVTVSNEGRGGLLAGLRATVSGCTFSGNNIGSNNGVTVGSASIVRNCTIIDYGGTGIMGAFTSIIENNIVSSCAEDGIQCTGNRNIIRNNNVSSNTDDGIQVADTNRVENNTLAFNGDHGIEALNDNHIVGNFLDTDPIDVTGDSNLIDSNNIVDTAGIFSVRLGGDYNRLSRNSIASPVSNSGLNNLTFTIRNSGNFAAAGPWDNFFNGP